MSEGYSYINYYNDGVSNGANPWSMIYEAERLVNEEEGRPLTVIEIMQKEELMKEEAENEEEDED